MNYQPYEENNYTEINNNTNILENMNCNLPSFLFLSENDSNYFQQVNQNINYNKSDIIKKKYLSTENLNYLKEKLVQDIFIITNVKIKKQSNEIMLQTMFMIFDAYYCYLLNDIDKEVNKLNNKTLEVLKKIILSEINFNNKYKKDINTLYTFNDIKPIYNRVSGTNVINNERIFDLYN